MSAPTIYAIFQSKRGLLRAIMDEALPSEQFEALVKQAMKEECPRKHLAISAKIARQMYDAERAQMDIFRSASVLSPEFKVIEQEREERRYRREEKSVKLMMKQGAILKHLSLDEARDILWAFTGRDMYRMFVVERQWSSDQYEKWLKELLIKSLLI